MFPRLVSHPETKASAIFNSFAWRCMWATCMYQLSMNRCAHPVKIAIFFLGWTESRRLWCADGAAAAAPSGSNRESYNWEWPWFMTVISPQRSHRPTCATGRSTAPTFSLCLQLQSITILSWKIRPKHFESVLKINLRKKRRFKTEREQIACWRSRLDMPAPSWGNSELHADRWCWHLQNVKSKV